VPIHHDRDWETQRAELVRRLGEQPNKEIDSWQVKNENIQEYTNELKKLQDEEITLDFTPLKLEEMGNIDINLNHYLIGFLSESWYNN